MKKRKSKKPNLMKSQHDKHGQGTAENGPDESDCACRNTDKEKACARAHCGFCLASLEEKNKMPTHCDDYLDEPANTPQALLTWLERARMPGHGMHVKDPWPECYADWEGKTVRLTMASRLGSVGWSSDLKQEVGYEHRGWLEQLTNFRDKP